MKKFARLEDGKVAEYREMNLKDIPKHKRQYWLKVIDKPPTFDSKTHYMNGPEAVIHEDHIEFKYVVHEKAPKWQKKDLLALKQKLEAELKEIEEKLNTLET